MSFIKLELVIPCSHKHFLWSLNGLFHEGKENFPYNYYDHHLVCIGCVPFLVGHSCFSQMFSALKSKFDRHFHFCAIICKCHIILRHSLIRFSIRSKAPSSIKHVLIPITLWFNSHCKIIIWILLKSTKVKTLAFYLWQIDLTVQLTE